MKLVVQRVEKAKVIKAKDGEILGKIDGGLFVLVGFKKGDTKKDVEMLTDKLFKLRVMGDEKDKMNLTVKDTGGKFLVVSQFTLYADTKKGNRPSFIYAEDPKIAKELYDYFLIVLKNKGAEVESGSFGDYMKIETVLNGPVTILYG